MTLLSTIHPYPAMIADDLASSLAEEYVQQHNLVVDPFCGTGRTLMASAERGAICFGIDVNPLAVLLANAKANNPDLSFLREMLRSLPGKIKAGDAAYCLEPGRRVNWFSDDAKAELSAIIDWINGQRLQACERDVLAAILSATARDVSFCRKQQWKLHRMSAAKRAEFSRSAWQVFSRRFRKFLDELSVRAALNGTSRAVRGDARALDRVLPSEWRGAVDIVFTSPPYGDSRTTVAYGAVSGICLGVIRNISGLDGIYLAGGEIDRLCLGGRELEMERDVIFNVSEYWKGDIATPGGRRVARYLRDLYKCFVKIPAILKTHGRVICILSRRRVDGCTLAVDDFVHWLLGAQGLSLELSFERKLVGKRTPSLINSKARDQKSSTLRSHVMTMAHEIILVFRKDLSRQPRITSGDA